MGQEDNTRQGRAEVDDLAEAQRPLLPFIAASVSVKQTMEASCREQAWKLSRAAMLPSGEAKLGGPDWAEA